MAKSKYTNIGGQALLEGVMMRGSVHTAMSVRNTAGDVEIEVFPTVRKERPAICKKPFIRGIFGLIDSLAIGYKCLMRSADLSGMAAEEEAEKQARRAKKSKFALKMEDLLEKFMMPIATVLAVALAVLLFMYLPVQLYTWLSMAFPSIAQNYFLRSVFEGVIRIIIFLAYVMATALMKDIRRTYQYHGAEHKTIFCYEKGLPLTVENVRAQKRFHPRCGTSFLVLMLLVGIVVSMFIRVDNPFLRTGLKILTFPILISIGYELIQYAGRHDSRLTRIISAPGVAIQHITTREPDDGMIQCAIESMLRVIPGAEGYPERETRPRALVDADTGAQTAPPAPEAAAAVENNANA